MKTIFIFAKAMVSPGGLLMWEAGLPDL